MKSPLAPFCLVTLDHSLPIRWDGRTPLTVGFPRRFRIERAGTHITVRALNREPSRRTGAFKKSFGSLLSGESWTLPGLGSLRLTRLSALSPVSWEVLDKIRAPLIPASVPASPEDRRFASDLKKGAVLLAAIVLAMLLLPKPAPEEAPSNALPAVVKINPVRIKTVRIKTGRIHPVRTKTFRPSSQPEATGSSAVFQSRSVKESLGSISSGASGASLGKNGAIPQSTANLARTLSGPLTKSGAAGGVPSLSGALKGNSRGAEAPAVSGQGKGQLEIGLDTSGAEVDEGLTREEVARVIHAHLNEIRYCYESGILRDPALSGKLLVDFQIGASGRVPDAAISEATLNGGGVGPCLLSKLRTWKFPEPRGGVKVAIRYPFIFKSVSR